MGVLTLSELQPRSGVERRRGGLPVRVGLCRGVRVDAATHLRSEIDNTDVLGYSDTIGTRQKYHCIQVSLEPQNLSVHENAFGSQNFLLSDQFCYFVRLFNHFLPVTLRLHYRQMLPLF